MSNIPFVSDQLFPDNVKLKLGDSSDLVMYHNTYNFIESSTKFDFNVVEIDINDYAGTTNVMDIGGTIRLYHGGTNRFETTSAGVQTNGTQTIATISEIGSDTDKFLMSDGGEVKFVTGANLRSYIGAGTGSGTVTGSGSSGRVAYWNGGSSITSDADLTFDGANLTCGGVYLSSNGSKSAPAYTFTGDSNTGMYREGADNIGFTAGGTTYLAVSSSGVGVSSNIYHIGDTDTKISFGANTIEFDTGGTNHVDMSSAGTRFGTQARFTSNATFDTDSKATFGDSGTLEIYNNGTDSYIDDVSTGDLRIRSNFLKIEKYTGETMADFNDDNAVRLYYNNNQRWETLSDGAGTDGDIIETISNGGGKRIGFNVGDSFTHNGNTIAHYGISNADNSTDGGIVLSGYFGLKFATNGAIRATIQNDGDTALLSHTLVSGFEDSNGSTAYYYIPIAGSINEGTSNQYYRNFACPNSGRVVSIMMMHTSGSAVALTTATTQLRVIKNGSTAATSSELSASNGNNDGSYIEYAADVDFSKGDRLGFQFSKSSTSMRWAGTSATIIIELDDYNL